MSNYYYFDDVSTTKPCIEVVELHDKLLKKYFANSDSLHEIGIEAYSLLEKSRALASQILKVKKNEIIFTYGASESNNLAIKGLFFNNLNSSKHIIVSPYEHSSVYNAINQLKDLFGARVEYLKIDKNGKIDFQDLKLKLKKDTLLVSVMAINNENGVINDVDEIGIYVKKNSDAYFHCDCTQAIGKISFSFDNIDLASFSAHKFCGLKGSGVLIKKQYVNIVPLISGGQQEFGLRAGTSDYIKHICLVKALKIAYDEMDKKKDAICFLMKYLKEEITKIKGVEIVSYDNNHIYNLLLLKTPIKSEVMLNALNSKRIFVSAKSTCGTRSNEESLTAFACGYDADYVIRISLNEKHCLDDINYLCKSIEEVIEKWKY